MSATLDAKVFQGYFNNPPLIHITGRNFQVDIRYLSSRGSSASFTTAAVIVVCNIHNKQPKGDILVFLPGEDDITTVCKLIRQSVENIDVFPLYSALPANQQELALTSSGPNRKCIVSTNIAETSLTIDNIVYVVDSGFTSIRQATRRSCWQDKRWRVLPSLRSGGL